MFINKRIRWAIPIAILALLVLGGTVLAEGEVPPVEPAPVAAAVEPVPAGEVLPPEEPALPLEETAPAEAPAPVSPAPDTAAGETLVDGLNVTAAGDPWWMVGSQKYAVVTAAPNCPSGTSIAADTCWVNSDPIEDALVRISNGLLPTDRKLYVEAGSYDDSIHLNGSIGTLGQMKGIIGPASVNGNYTATLSGPVTIRNVLSGFTLSGFNITSPNVYMYDNTGAIVLNDLYLHNTSLGLQVWNHNGSILLNQVRAEENDRYGVILNNTSSSSAGITIANSSFNYNNRNAIYDYYSGLDISTNGPLVINGVSSSYNHGDGLELHNASSVSIKNSVFSWNDDIDDGGDYGWGVRFEIQKSTPVTLDNVYANDNEEMGIDISVGGKITVSNVFASGNDAGGAYLDNCGYDSGTGQCNNTLFTPVLVSNSYFENNTFGDGLEIRSKAAVTLTSVHAFNNVNGDGVYINNCNSYLGVCQGSGNVLVTSNLAAGESGLNYFGFNGDDGLQVISKGAVSLNNFTAEFNDSDGVVLGNNLPGAVGGVTVKSTLAGWENICSYNSTEGLDVDSNGTILVDRIRCIGNHGVGIDLDNENYPYIKNITLSNAESDQNWLDGIQADTLGNITIINVTAGHNDNPGDSLAYHGMALDNAGGTGNVVIKSTSPSVFYDFDYNSGHGIELLTNGTAAISNVNAYGNVDDGLRIGGANDPKLLIMTRCSADNNGENGINAQVEGSALLTNVSASRNDWNGIILYSGGAVILKTSSTLAMNEFSENGAIGNYDGLYISASGAITIQNTDAYSNTAHGMTTWNTPSLLTPVRILRSQADDNHYGGYDINTNGVLTVTDSSADGNDSWGLSVDTDSAVTVNCTGPAEACSFSYNLGDGLYIASRKPITITKVVANGNTDDGMELYNYTTPTDFIPDPITLTKIRVESNWDNGILALTEGNVLLNTVIANANDTGVSLGTSTDHVNNATVLGTNLFEDNDTGLRVYANGIVSISNVTAQHQTTGRGIYVIAYTEGKSVTLNNVTTRYNFDDGIHISSQGNVTLNYVRSIANYSSAADGLWLVVPDQEDIVTISNSLFTINADNGIDANIFDPVISSHFRLINTSWLGNDSDNNGNADLLLY